MNITKCDMCGKTIKKRGSKLSIGGSVVQGWGVDACEKCAVPFIQLLKKSDLIENDNRA